MLTLSGIDPLQAYAGYAPSFVAPGAFGGYPGSFAPTYGGGLASHPFAGSMYGQPAGPLGRLIAFQADPSAGAPAAGPATQVPPGVLMPQNSLDPELQAAASFVQDTAGGIIRRLHDYLQTHHKTFSQLAEAVPLVQRAVDFYGARDYARAYAQAYQAYRAVALVRARQPDLPSL